MVVCYWPSKGTPVRSLATPRRSSGQLPFPGQTETAMPTKAKMTWVSAQRRWQKWYKGKNYAVSCRQLGAPGTKEGSVVAANRWWDAKQKELDASQGEHDSERNAVLAVSFSRALVWRHQLAEDAQREVDKQRRLARQHLERVADLPPNEIPFLESHRKQYADVYAQYSSVSIENSIRAHITDYMSFRQSQLATGKNRPATYETIRCRLKVFSDWLPPDAKIDDLNEELLEQFYRYLLSEVSTDKTSKATANSVLVATKSFVRNRYQKRLIDLPRNLPALVIGTQQHAVVVFTLDEIRRLLDAATDRTKLYLLLALNCGMYPSDMGAIQHDEVDWQVGRIARRRTKTQRHKNVPVVNYLLWKQTFDLLKQECSTHESLVLLNEGGSPLWEVRQSDKGTIHTNSNIRSAWFRLAKETSTTKPMKSLRKTAASILDTHAEFANYVHHYLGHAGDTIAAKHYVAKSQERFDAAITWLGQQLGIEPMAHG